jgi:hypothetical protein
VRFACHVHENQHMYVHTSTFLGFELQFLPQSGIFTHFWAQFFGSAPDFGLTSTDFVHVQCFFMSCTCTPARFGVTSCNFCLRVEFLRTFGPSARFWAWILTPAEMCGHTGTFVQATCIFCLRVEILCAVLGSVLGPVPDFGPWILTPAKL